MGLSPTTYGSAYGISLIYYSICYTLLIFLWLLQLVRWLQVPISRERRTPIVGQHHQHLSKCKRVCTSLAEGKIKELTKLNPRGVYSEKTSPAESTPIIKFPPPVLRESPKHTQPSPPNELVKLHQIVKKSPHISYKKACTHYRHILKGTQICNTKRQ